MNLFYLFILWLPLFGSANGEISVTLLDEKESPIAQETIQFMTQQQQVLGNCITNTLGRCTITIQDAPTDASGFIRGALSIKDHGRRPIIWPGGLITIQLQLSDTGTLDVPSDLYVTRTPKASPQTLESEVTQTKTSALPSPTIPASTSTVVSTPISVASVVSTPISTASVVSTPINTTTHARPPIEDKTLWGLSYSLWFQIGLLIILIVAATYYVLATLNNRNEAS